MRQLLIFLTSLICVSAQTWVEQTSGTEASLRGVSAVSAKVAWASGAKGTYLKTTDGGAHWITNTVPGAEQLDFRDVEAVSERVALLMSAGTGELSRVYRTVDGGAHWKLVLQNPDPKGFFDSMAFADSSNGAMVGDPVDGHFVVYTTADGGQSWKRQKTPEALPAEGAFAASGTAIAARGNKRWFATGGPGCARVFYSLDAGRTWNVGRTPIRNDGPAAGIFGLYFFDDWRGMAVGGDYNKPAESRQNVAMTLDGGRTWRSIAGRNPDGFRSAIARVGEHWIAVGTSGSDISRDNGETWSRFDSGAWNAISFANGGVGWAVGPKGRVARFANHPWNP